MNSNRPRFVKALVGILLISVLGLAFLIKSTVGLNAGLKQFAIDFRVANQSETIDPMLELYCLDGVDEPGIIRLKAALKYELGLSIKKIEFEPLQGAPEETIQFDHNGTIYGPTLKPRYRMRVTYKGNDKFTSLYTIGKSDSGSWQFISARPVSTADN